jgi:hypothetical protein
MMRFFLSALFTLVLVGCASTPKSDLSSVEIKEIKPRYMDKAQFMRISEYWSGTEHQGKRLILRSDPAIRDGYYFTLILDEKLRRLPKGTVIIGEFYTPKSVELQTHEFKLPSKRPKTKEVFVGLTGEDWPEPGGVPGAWRFTIKDPNGAVLAERRSYLWSL